MKKSIPLAAKKFRSIGLLISFIVTVLLFASCSKEDVSPNSSAVGQSQSPATLAVRDIIGNQIVPTVPSDAMIFIVHGGCMGTCPVYSIVIRPDGIVRFTGYAHVATMGTTQFSITPAKVIELRSMMLNRGFLNLKDAYPYVLDLPQYVTAMRLTAGSSEVANEFKVVVDYGVQVPPNIASIRNSIEYALGIDKLVHGGTIQDVPVNN